MFIWFKLLWVKEHGNVAHTYTRKKSKTRPCLQGCFLTLDSFPLSTVRKRFFFFILYQTKTRCNLQFFCYITKRIDLMNNCKLRWAFWKKNVFLTVEREKECGVWNNPACLFSHSYRKLSKVLSFKSSPQEGTKITLSFFSKDYKMEN